VRERAIKFGQGQALVGILAEPTGDMVRRDLPAVILLNSGVLHRVGACRLHVKIARALAPSGYACLRFDHAGIGDSEARRDNLPFAEAAQAEVREAMDYVSGRRGTDRFLLMGLCSGADIGFAVACQDERVVGLVQLDPYVYRNWRYHVHHYVRRAGQWEAWRNWVAHRIARLFQRPAAVVPTVDDLSPDHVLPEYSRRFPPRDHVAAGLRLLAERGVPQLAILTGGHEAHYNYRSQYRDVFRDVSFGELLQEEFVREADHIITGLDDQRQVVGLIQAWVEGLPLPSTSARQAEAPGRAAHGAPARQVV
jgi:hypothetical protein